MAPGYGRERAGGIPYLTQWKLVRSAIEHENTLKSHRVTWFLATQLFLFTGFTSVFVEAIKTDFLLGSHKVYGILMVISSLGVYACVLAWANLRAAQKMIVRLHNWWLCHCHPRGNNLKSWIFLAKYGEGQRGLPPVNGMFTSKLHIVFDEIGLPKALAVFWGFLMAASTVMILQKRYGVFPLASLHALALLGIILFARTKSSVRRWLNAPDSTNVSEIVLLAQKLGIDQASEPGVRDTVVDILSQNPGPPDACTPN